MTLNWLLSSLDDAARINISLGEEEEEVLSIKGNRVNAIVKGKE